MKIVHMNNYYDNNYADIKVYRSSLWNPAETSFKHCTICYLLIRRQNEDST